MPTTAVMTIEVAAPDSPHDFDQVDQFDARVRRISLTSLGEQARNAAGLYRAAANVAGTVRVTLTLPAHNDRPARSVAAYAGPAPDVDNLTPAQRALLNEAYGAGAVIRAEQHPVANELVNLQLLHRAGRVHGAVSGRQYVPAGPVRVDYAVETVTAGRLAVVHGHRHLPTADPVLLDQVAAAIAAHHPDAVRVSLHTVDPVTGEVRTAWTQRHAHVEG